ncbi:HAD-IA family hydrolase [Microbacterium album]|uniref:HAD-IA family hydrolase n=1 Tax=Microbacterium album TaxID=2053191 RepID=UPI001E631306|nr:HAD-IA family hydrolase [Microbacterium album]
MFDVLGTLVDQAGSLRRRIMNVTDQDASDADRVAAAWLDYVAMREHQITAGDAPFVASHVLDDEALALLVADGVLPAEAHQPLASGPQHLEPWADSVDGVALLADSFTIAGLSNASHQVLAELIESSGMRLQLVLSAEDASTYKPDPAVYQLALTASPVGAPPPYLVAAHAWDLRAAANAGMRTAYVPRPGGDAPLDDDEFDIYADDPADPHARLLACT